MSITMASNRVDFNGSLFLKSSSVRAIPNRLNWRAEVLLSRNAAAFRGKRVLDLASHDGRFMHAALANGASHVVGVEVREEHVRHARENLTGCGYAADRFEAVCGDFVQYLKTVEAGAFDTILCFGVLSHMVEHVEIFSEIRRIAPENFILDTWVALPRWNLRERARNWRVNRYVANMQQGGGRPASAFGRLLEWIDDVVPGRGNRVGTLVFLYEDTRAPGATARQSGLMAWGDRTLVEMLFDHYDFTHRRVDWRAQGVDDWTELDDYRRGARESWIATLPRPTTGG
jgi:hypothetical protein